MALYSATFSDWALAFFPLCGLNRTADRISAYGILRLKYPDAVTVPNVGMHLQIIPSGSLNLYAAYDLVNPLTTISTPFEVGFSPKNSINADDYVLGSSGSVTVLFEVG